MLAGLDYGSASATARAVPLDEEAEQRIPAMFDNYIDAAQRVQAGDADREFPLHRQMYQLMALADETHAITIQTDGKQVVVKAPLAPLTRSAAERPQEVSLEVSALVWPPRRALAVESSSDGRGHERTRCSHC